jgi:phosphoribosylamine---glycine ligase
VFGPKKDAARIEASKAYAKDLMRRAGVPTAEHRTFTERGAAEAWVREQGAPIVVKASGLAAGKGAVVCASEDEALGAVRAMLSDLEFGEAGREVVIEEHMEGEELSVFAVTDGEHFVVLVPVAGPQARRRGRHGPQHRGDGRVRARLARDPEVVAEARSRVFRPTLAALAADGCPFKGLLYAGLMLTDRGLKRGGVQLPLRGPGDAGRAAAHGLLAPRAARDSRRGGLPRRPRGEGARGRGRDDRRRLSRLPWELRQGQADRYPEGLEGDELILFHAGTELHDGKLLSSGGRVLAVTALADTFAAAVDASRAGAAAVRFDGAFFRSDIGWREQARVEVG